MSEDSTPLGSGDTGAERVKAVPVRHPMRWVLVIVLLVLGAQFVHGLATNPVWQWQVVWDNLFTSQVFGGVLVTMELTILAMLIGIVLGIVVAIMRLSPNPILSGLAWLYAWFFRGTPVLVQVVFWSYIGLLYHQITLGIPFGKEYLFWDPNTLIPVFTGAVLGLGLNEAAYMSEIVRAGILSVDPGQTEAAESLGMTRLKIMRRIVLPQAMRVIIPPTGNEIISMLKTTSIVTVVGLYDLFGVAKLIYGQRFQVQIPLLVVASLWYLALTSVLSVGQYYIERYYARGTAARRPSLLDRLRRGAR